MDYKKEALKRSKVFDGEATKTIFKPFGMMRFAFFF